ncbi:DNA/RNA nuclease SfsA [Kordiimonas lacus]|uniref:Sugar fermentation stimulation protein homolog n=1 Tax=Kordiimonas lacus TaxID=637679 RepID=A0A1G6VG84_9PROT|nr:DNA/RNA nuclease SfsA [Kordiimonas lacus]SDD52353.1 sugar fermentation stimulation protein A [Kordiimonas lacus]
MIFENRLTEGRLIKRYKRFLADVELPDGSVVVAHCANSGSMLGCKEPGSRVYLSPNTNPKAKLDWRWEMVEVDGHLVGINTSHPNKLAEEAILGGVIPELSGYASLRREVKYGQNSRIDILLEEPEKTGAANQCFVEVKNVTLRVGNDAQFPDAVTARGTKHLRELMDMVAEGHRAVMLYLVQRGDCLSFAPATDIDPTYAATLKEAIEAGVETLCYVCDLSTDGIRVDRPMSLGF